MKSGAAEDTSNLNTLLKRESLVVNGRVGHGGCSDVYSVTRLTDKRNFALKVFRSGPRQMEHFSTELDTLQHLRSAHVVAVEAAYCETGEPACILLELCQGGDLFERIMSRGQYNEADASKFMLHFVESLKVLKAKNMMHLDIKPENIMFKYPGESSPPVLVDFNLSRAINKVKPCKVVGTLGYSAPEVILKDNVGPAADVFSAGVTLYIMLCASYPFTAHTTKLTVQNTLQGSLSYATRPAFLALSASARDLLHRMMHVDPDLRITVDEISAHPWMKETFRQHSKSNYMGNCSSPSSYSSCSVRHSMSSSLSSSPPSSPTQSLW